MNEKGIIMILLGIIGTLLLILAMAQFYGAGWTTVSQGVTSFIVAIVAFAIAISAAAILIAGRR